MTILLVWIWESHRILALSFSATFRGAFPFVTLGFPLQILHRCTCRLQSFGCDISRTSHGPPKIKCIASSAFHCLGHSQDTLSVGALCFYSWILDVSSWIVTLTLNRPQPASPPGLFPHFFIQHKNQDNHGQPFFSSYFILIWQKQKRSHNWKIVIFFYYLKKKGVLKEKRCDWVPSILVMKSKMPSSRVVCSIFLSQWGNLQRWTHQPHVSYEFKYFPFTHLTCLSGIPYISRKNKMRNV